MDILINGLEIDPMLDGETHINAYSNSNCSLGRMLSNFIYMPTETVDGMFDSMEGYYHWLKLSGSLDKAINKPKGWGEKLNNLREVSGHSAMRLGRAYKEELKYCRVPIFEVPDEKFNKHFHAGLLEKIISHTELYTEIMSNRLPIVHYYLIGDRIIYKPRFNWLSNHLNDINVKLLGY